MKVSSGSPFQKLIAGKVGENKERETARSSQALNAAVVKVSENVLLRAAESNKEAATSISRVATAEVTSEEKKRNSEVEKNNRLAAEASVENVERFVDLLATRIKDNPDEALVAQANQENDKVQELLQ